VRNFQSAHVNLRIAKLTLRAKLDGLKSNVKGDLMTSKNAWTQTVIISFLAFAGLGLTGGLLGVAWPSIRDGFRLADSDVSLLFLFQTLAYTLASFYIGRLMFRFSSGTTFLFGAMLTMLCMFGMSIAPSWAIVVLVGLFYGFGSGMIDAGLNMYIATYHTAQQMNFLHAFYGIGITIGPLIMTFVLQPQTTFYYLEKTSALPLLKTIVVGLPRFGWHAGYAIVGVIFIGVLLMFLLTRRAWRSEGFSGADKLPVRRASFIESLRTPAVWFGMATFLAYVGLEIGIGQWAYTILTDSRGMRPEEAGPWVSIYWGTFTVGRLLWGFIANRYEIEKVLRFCMVGALVGAVLFWWNPIQVVGLFGLIVVGFAQAPIFAMFMAGTERRVGSVHAENTINLQMSAAGIGTAMLPGFIGTLGKNYGLETMAAVFVLMAVIVVIFHELTLMRRVQEPILTSAGD
jgi:fucose permease